MVGFVANDHQTPVVALGAQFPGGVQAGERGTDDGHGSHAGCLLGTCGALASPVAGRPLSKVDALATPAGAPPRIALRWPSTPPRIALTRPSTPPNIAPTQPSTPPCIALTQPSPPPPRGGRG
ncbi:hypothetical protein GCM10010383_42640 [Streptomyces lomondensis]|uniref:Uncharacterized protein n=1 Tax=Streptomyces lomondensis TaxID=68229 RepID=A0ABQ2XB21_9ACTN|nr:hypothetical protein GCM10010383_42640 [Streptomyces lomondensis]